MLKRNCKENIDSVSTRFILKTRLYGFNKNLIECIQTRCNMRRVDTRLKKTSKRVWTPFFSTTCLNAIWKKWTTFQHVSEKHLMRLNPFCLLTAFKRVSNIFSTPLGRNHIFERVCTHLFLVYQTRFYSKNCSSRGANWMIEIIGLHIFYSSELH